MSNREIDNEIILTDKIQRKERKKEQLASKKERKVSSKNEVFNERRKKEVLKEDEEINLCNNEIILSDEALPFIDRSKSTKELKKRMKKTSKTPSKIKVKNKFFADIEINPTLENDEDLEDVKNLVEEEISNSQSNRKKTSVNKDLIIEKIKESNESLTSQKLQSMVQKTEFFRARNDFKKLEDDKNYKSYLKKKMKEVEEVEEVVITELEVPHIHRNKLVSSTIYLNHENFKKENNKKNQKNETPKKMTAEEIIKERKLLKNRNYFYKKLGETIKKEKIITNYEDINILNRGSEVNLESKTSSESSKETSKE